MNRNPYKPPATHVADPLPSADAAPIESRRARVLRMIISLLYASAVATFVFALAWIRPPLSTSALTSIVGLFVGFGFMFAILSLRIGFPLALLIEWCRIGTPLSNCWVRSSFSLWWAVSWGLHFGISIRAVRLSGCFSSNTVRADKGFPGQQRRAQSTTPTISTVPQDA